MGLVLPIPGKKSAKNATTSGPWFNGSENSPDLREQQAAAHSQNAEDVWPGSPADSGFTAFGGAFWRDALIGAKGDSNGDGRVSVEEAAAYTRQVGVSSGWTALSLVDDQIRRRSHFRLVLSAGTQIPKRACEDIRP